jgi:hypothetical protein
MNAKKGQGLPMNFIIIAALAVIVLIIITVFVLVSGSSFGSALSPAQHSSRCNSLCLTYQKTMKGPVLAKNDAFCVDQDLRDGTKVSCEDTDPCYIIYSDGSQKKLSCGK